MLTMASTKPPIMPISHGVMLGAPSVMTVERVQTQPTTAVTSSAAKRPTVFQTVSSTVMRSVSIEPAGGVA